MCSFCCNNLRPSFLHPTRSRNSQIRGHIAGSSSPSPLRFVPCIFIAERLHFSTFFPRRLASNCAYIRPEYLTKTYQKRKPPYKWIPGISTIAITSTPLSQYTQVIPATSLYLLPGLYCQRQVFSPRTLTQKRRTTICCPNKWLGNDCCAHVSTRRRLWGVFVYKG